MRGALISVTGQELFSSLCLNPSNSELIHLEFGRIRRLGRISSMKVVICLSVVVCLPNLVFFFFVLKKKENCSFTVSSLD